MISHSTKQKRRRNAAYMRLERTIEVRRIQRCQGFDFYLVSLPLSSTFAVHREARGLKAALKQYEELRLVARSVANQPQD